MSRKSSKRKVRLVRAPVMRELHERIAMSMHTSLVLFEKAPTGEAFGCLRDIFNMVGLAIEGREKYVEHMVQINLGATALNFIADRGTVNPTEEEMAHLRSAVTVIDAMLPSLDVVALHLANVRANVLGGK